MFFYNMFNRFKKGGHIRIRLDEFKKKLYLPSFDMGWTKTFDYYDKALLDRAKPLLLMNQFAETKPLPTMDNKIKFRYYQDGQWLKCELAKNNEELL